MAGIRIVIEGIDPRTKKTHNRVVRRGDFYSVLPSAQFVEWFNAAMTLVPDLKRAAAREGITLPIQGQVHVNAQFYLERDYGGDVTGYMQAVGDWLQERKVSKPSRKRPIPKLIRNGAGIITDDRNIASWDGTRVRIDRARPRIEILIEPFQEHLELFDNTPEESHDAPR